MSKQICQERAAIGPLGARKIVFIAGLRQRRQRLPVELITLVEGDVVMREHSLVFGGHWTAIGFANRTGKSEHARTLRQCSGDRRKSKKRQKGRYGKKMLHAKVKSILCNLIVSQHIGSQNVRRVTRSTSFVLNLNDQPRRAQWRRNQSAGKDQIASSSATTWARVLEATTAGALQVFRIRKRAA